jgi:tetraacyldisaccharide 4'-kinase
MLLPISVLYGIGVSIYQSLYQTGILKSVRFSFPVLSIGNLTVGGTGKTPHVEYLIRLLTPYLEMGVLSRGYKRRSRGFLFVEPQHDASLVGDEPRQIADKFPGLAFAVAENRALAIPRMLRERPELQLIVLDDGYQHFPVRAGLQLLLTEYARPYTRDFLLPTGRLREWSYGAARANAVIVTKCPEGLERSQREQMRTTLRLKPEQSLFFSGLRYGEPYHLFHPGRHFLLNPSVHVTVISAIAQADYLVDYLEPRVGSLQSFHFEDHHYFTETELDGLLSRHRAVTNTNKMILTTEKDATRLRLHRNFLEQRQAEVYVLPVEVYFYDPGAFDDYIRSFLTGFRV